MKKINFTYIAAVAVAFILWRISDSLHQESLIFYGFAENKETEINAEYPVEVKKIYVTTGQKVKAGTVLADTEQADLPKRQSEAALKIEQINAENALRASDLRARIGELEARKSQKTGEIDNEINQLRLTADRNRQLLKEIEATGENTAAVETEIAALEEEKRLLTAPIDVQINNLRTELRVINSPSRAQIKRLQNEADYYENKTGKFALTAPTDGLIGNIHVKEAEFVSSFNTLITFYEENPTLVNGFVHENMSVHVAVGDTLEVISTVRPSSKCTGVVTGLGSRYVEIPPRLRKMPEIKTYGREILITIPRQNAFLQKEKVMLKLMNKPDLSNGLFGFAVGSLKIGAE